MSREMNCLVLSCAVEPHQLKHVQAKREQILRSVSLLSQQQKKMETPTCVAIQETQPANDVHITALMNVSASKVSRFATLGHYPTALSNVFKTQLAESGLFYTGNARRLRCCRCGRIFDDVCDDDVINHHCDVDDGNANPVHQ